MLSLLATLILCPQFSGNQEFDASIEKIRKDSGTPGVSIVVSRGGKILYSRGFGSTSLKLGSGMDEGSVHELASVSKQFTAAAILLLQQDGKLSIDDKLSKFFLSKSKNWDGITLRNVLQHTSGLPDYLEFVKMEKDYTSAQLIGFIREKKLDFEPGTKWAYSNSGYMLLGFVVEKVAKTKFNDFLAKRIYGPAGMESAGANDPWSKTIVMGYSKRAGKVVEQGTTSKSLSQTGDGQVMCSALDLAHWNDALWSGKILSSKLRDLMHTAGPVPPDPKNPDNGYGMGMGIAKKDGRKSFHHGGGWMGTSTFVSRDEKSGTYFVILCNADFGNPQAYLPTLEKKFLP